MDGNLNSEEIKDLTKILKPLYNNKIKLNKYKNLNYDYENSSINRFMKIIDMETSINLSKTNTIYTVLRIYRNNKFINYGYMYGLNINGEIVNKFILASNSIISKDGMYSYRIINYQKISKKSIVIDKVYDYIINFIKNNTIKLEVDVFNIDNESLKKSYINKYKNNKILILIYCIGWIIEMYNIDNDIQDANLNQIYNDVMFGENDKKFYSSLYLKFKNEINNLINYFKYFSCVKCTKLGLGQKVMSLNYEQLKEYNNIKHYQWKEILINKIVSDLIYNMVSPCFSMFVDWIIIKKSNRFLYDNENIYNKILASDKAKDLIYHINAIKEGFTDMYNKKRTKILARLIKKFKLSMELIENNILMSDISICLISEYSGKSLYQYLIKNHNLNRIGDLYNNYEIVQKYIFEIIYGLYCLNLKGIIHGDLHLNNILLNIQRDIQNIDNYIIYNLNITDEFNNNIYMFKHLGTYACLIDFGRSYVNTNQLEHIELSNNNYLKNEQKRIIKELETIFPNAAKNNKPLSKTNNFNTLFTYFMAIDMYNLSNKLYVFIENYCKVNNIKINDKIITLLTNINKKTYDILFKSLDANNYLNADITNPNLELINEFFQEFKISSDVKNKQISDIFNLNNINKNYDKKNMINEIIEHIPLNTLNTQLKNKLNFALKKNYNKELEVEQVLNKEYYESRKILLSSKLPLTDSFSVTESFSNSS